MRIEGKRGALVSIIPFSACRGVTLRGLHYPLREAALPVGRIGASNVVEKSPFTVSVKKGKLLVVVFDMTVPKRSSRRW
jgi:thiamine pyrophosphokinase